MSKTSYCFLQLQRHPDDGKLEPCIRIGKDREDADYQKWATQDASGMSPCGLVRRIPSHLAEDPAFEAIVDALLKEAYRHQLKKEKA